ncbi:polysaccharide biosynthesis tyrosine autokinase [Ornithinimicrobium humiphilum]|uniref:non-specific protein-tyrosine kinase n=1 Tax=Ornithinimicrobium humiphilum TaxID=125288 RepID=A0A543KJK8_9MICO|nr:polysaccharide biosynthesis tyrosine autokinase [Ornithinimicrobium humiphilum]TQM95272.1 capsular exopolysaccharide synthesis family protein [Ornithinimicrobium humiphilum]
MTVRDLLLTLKTRWRIIVATLLVVVAATAWLTLQITPVYQSSTRVYLLANNQTDSANVYNMPAAELETIIQVATSPIVLDPVREELGIDESTMLAVSAERSGDTPLLDVVVRAHDARVAAAAATAVPQHLAAVARDFSPMLQLSGTTVSAQTVVPSTVASSPVEPKPVQNLALGALAGLLLGIAFALARQALDQRVRDPRDLEALADRPVLGSIPVRRGSDRHALYLEIDPFGPHAEAIRRLRTNMMFVDVTTGRHSFVISSTLPGEGKTTTAINLALAMSDAGSKVLLIDADLRHPSVATNLGLEGAVGLTTVLLGEADVQDVIQRWGGTSMHVLTSGDIPPNPSELLGSTKMRELFESLSDDYDFILVDSPPVLPVTDALVVEKLTGGVLMVVASGETRKRHLSEAMRVLGTSDSTIAGFVLTKTPSQPTSYYTYYSTQDSGGRRRASGRDKKMAKAYPHAEAAAAERARRTETRAESRAEARAESRADSQGRPRGERSARRSG